MSRRHSGNRPGRGRRLRKLAGFTIVLGCLAGPATAAAAPTAAVQAHLMWSQYDSGAVDRQLDRAREAGAGMLRVDVGWASLEPDAKGRYAGWYLDKLDQVVAKAKQRDLKLLLTFWETPCWASAAPESLKQGCAGAWWDRGVQRYPPADPRDYADALEFVVRRYGDRVAAWEIWNEPNQDDFFVASDQAAAYAALVKAGYPVAKRADPATTVVAGSLADSDYAFTERLLELGVGGNFDAWSVHPYSEDRSPLSPGVPGWSKKSMSAGVPQVHEALLRHGQDKPLWLTEFGWSNCSVRGGAAWENCVDEAAQADYLRQSFDLMRSWSYVQVGVWFNLQDTDEDRSSRVDNYGLLRYDGSEKPAYAAFAQAARALATGAPMPGGRPRGGKPATERRRKRIRLKVFRRGGRVYARGRAPEAKTVTIRGYRFGFARRRYGRQAGYLRVIRVKRSGRFRARLARRLRSGRWRFVASARGTRLVSARSSLR